MTRGLHAVQCTYEHSIHCTNRGLRQISVAVLCLCFPGRARNAVARKCPKLFFTLSSASYNGRLRTSAGFLVLSNSASVRSTFSLHDPGARARAFVPSREDSQMTLSGWRLNGEGGKEEEKLDFRSARTLHTHSVGGLFSLNICFVFLPPDTEMDKALGRIILRFSKYAHICAFGKGV